MGIEQGGNNPLTEHELLELVNGAESIEAKTMASVFDMKESELNENILSVARKYCFDDAITGYEYSESLPNANKIFLAMLDEAVTKIGYHFAKKERFVAVDFGAGLMPYLHAYQSFFERYGMPQGEIRNVKIIGWDGGVDSHPGGNVKWIGSTLESQNDVRPHFNKGIDVVTMFACGPSAEVTDPQAIEESYNVAITAFSPFLIEGGLIILTTSFGGPKKNYLIRSLEKNDLEVVLDEPNKYNEKISLAIGNVHEDIIIAKKRTKEELIKEK